MTEAHKELAMENEAVALLDSKGWLYEEGSNARYDRKRALFPEDVFAWLEATQGEELAKFLHPGMDSTQEMKARDGILDFLGDLGFHLGRRGARLGHADRDEGHVDVGKAGDRQAVEALPAQHHEQEERQQRRDRIADRPGREVHRTPLNSSRRPPGPG